MPWKHLCGLIGLAFGWLVVQYGFEKAVFVVAIGGVGWVIGRVLDGEIDLSDFARRSGSEDLE